MDFFFLVVVVVGAVKGMDASIGPLWLHKDQPYGIILAA